ncbi:hypothetical protein GCM10007242_03180 [Pigmentiphaga litoralis]|nr:hypothetical protein GCM10007242_03180 [Pigmentiphaga litoralis]
MLVEKNRAASLRETIEELIAVGELSPGDALDETILAQRLACRARRSAKR